MKLGANLAFWVVLCKDYRLKATRKGIYFANQTLYGDHRCNIQ